jgi:ABC-type transporter Mla subunit MlaD
MKNKQDAIVATLVILCSLVLLGALIFAVGGNPWREPHLRFSVDFADVTGIHRNTEVLLAGDQIGMVDRIEHLTPSDRILPNSTVRVHIEVFEAVPVPARVKVIISAASMLGEKHIALIRLDDEDGLLADGDDAAGRRCDLREHPGDHGGSQKNHGTAGPRRRGEDDH